MRKLTIYTDGACNKKYVGGWGAVIFQPCAEDRINGGHLFTTNNRMELTAIIKALSFAFLKYGSCDISLFSDSMYCINGSTTWKHKWIKNDFFGIKSVDLWKELYNLIEVHQVVTFKWVKAHSKNYYNDIADHLAGLYPLEHVDTLAYNLGQWESQNAR
jgi:ribonuclease HI